MHKEHIAALHLGGEDAVLVDVLILDVETEAHTLTVVQKPGAVAASDDLDTAMLAKDVGRRYPYGEHFGLVGLGQGHPLSWCQGVAPTSKPAMRPR